jgi:hypothetical protein
VDVAPALDPSIDPADWAAGVPFTYKNFEFQFNPATTIHERMAVEGVLCAQVRDIWKSNVIERGTGHQVRDKNGKVIASGVFTKGNRGEDDEEYVDVSGDEED